VDFNGPASYIYAFDANNGTQYWKATMSHPADMASNCCGTGGSESLCGMIQTPYIDVAAGLIYGASDGYLHAFYLRNGTLAKITSKLYDTITMYTFGALNVDPVSNTLYIPLGANGNDGVQCVSGYFTNYTGQIIAVNLATFTVTNRFYTNPVSPSCPVTSICTPNTTWFGATIWGQSGVAIGPDSTGSTNYVWTATGNTCSSADGGDCDSTTGFGSENVNGGDSVFKLNTNLGSTPVTAWTTTALGHLFGGLDDGDFGSGPSIITPSVSSGCPINLIMTQHKSGNLLVVNQSNASQWTGYGVSGQTEIGGFIGNVAYNSLLNIVLITIPSTPPKPALDAVTEPLADWGVQGYRILPNCSLQFVYSTQFNLTAMTGQTHNGQASGGWVTTAADLGYFAVGGLGYAQNQVGLIVFDPLNGNVLNYTRVGAGITHTFPTSPAIAGGKIIFTLGDGPKTLHVYGLAPTPVSAKTDWLQYGYDNVGSNYNPYEVNLTASAIKTRGLKQLWAFQHPDYNTAILNYNNIVMGQPLLVNNMIINGATVDGVFIGTTYGSLYGLDANNGTLYWSRNFSSYRNVFNKCCDNFGTYCGIVGTPYIDKAANTMYVVSDGYFHGINISSGATIKGPLRLYDSRMLINWGGIKYDSSSSSLYITVGGNALDGIYNIPPSCSAQSYFTNYTGQIIKVDPSAFVVTARFYTETVSPSCAVTNPDCTPNTTAFGAGIWGIGGVSIGPDYSGTTNYIWSAVGNACISPNSCDDSNGYPAEGQGYGERVMKLSTGLSFMSGYGVLDVGHLIDGIDDGDFGASPVIVSPSPASGCTRNLIMAEHKSGILFVFDSTNMTNRWAYKMDDGGGDGNRFLMSASYHSQSNTVLVSSPATPTTSTDGVVVAGATWGLQAYKINSNCSLTLKYSSTCSLDAITGQTAMGIATQAVTAADVVYLAGGNPGEPNIGVPIVAVNISDGKYLWSFNETRGQVGYPYGITIASGKILFYNGVSGVNTLYAYGLN